ncbi:MAG TPA: pentapeptide repeat-containing protein [Geobacter sp.]|nr:pentapeptide repeat-containing protein [Geobacter sp.]
MDRRFRHLIAPLALGIMLQGMAFPAGSFAADPAQKEDPGEAQALKLAEQRLAALAREGASEAPPGAAATKKGAGKNATKAKRKGKGKVAKGRSAKSAKAKGEAKLKTEKVLERRMTPSEVQGILSTSRDFSGSDLSGLSLAGYDLRGAKFNRANLHSANLERADLAETDLELADLTGANLRGASLNQARLRGTRIAGAKMDGAMWIDKTICREGSVGSCIE